MKEENSICRICGYNYYPGNFWTDDRIAEFVICPSCSCESGYEDFNIVSIKRAREKWLEKTEYKFIVQLENISDKYK